MGVRTENTDRDKMIEIVDGSPSTAESSRLSRLYQKINKESKTRSPLYEQLLKSCEKFKSNLQVLSFSLNELLTVLESFSRICLSEGSTGLTQDIGHFLSEVVRKQGQTVESLDIFDL